MPHRFHPLLDQVRNALAAAGRGGSHRRLIPVLGSRRFRRGSVAVAMLAVVALASLAGTGPSVDAPEAAEPEPAPVLVAAQLPAPIGGLNERQMEHAATIVRVGQESGLPEYAYVVAIATALQESYLRVLASPVVPESANYPHDDGTVDHDSVGLFQQRPSQGWGTVAQCMDPEYAAGKFYEVLQQIPGWEWLPVSVAAQAVQQSAFPDHYAKHEPLARQLVDVLT